METEQWRVCVSDSRYEVSSLGRVRRVSTGRVRKPSNGGRGYQSIVVWRAGGKPRGLYVHHLVAEAFIGPRPDRCEVSHLDGDRQNNRATNLAYETHAENMARRHEHGTHFKGSHNPAARLSAPDVWRIHAARLVGMSAMDIAARLPVSIAQVHRILAGKNWPDERVRHLPALHQARWYLDRLIAHTDAGDCHGDR